MQHFPQLIQGGMGAGVSSWTLARAVSEAGHLGVVSGTALDALFVRRLQDGDPDGHVRRALDAFPIKKIADEIIKKYFVPEGKGPDAPYKMGPQHTLSPSRHLVELTIFSNFAEVFLAKEGHSGVVGINYLEKIQLPTITSIFGSMLAGVDYILMGAGIPRSIPGILDCFSRGEPAEHKIDVKGAPSDKEFVCSFDPRPYLDQISANLNRPKFLAIVSSVTLALTLTKKSNGKVDGFIVEGTSAGGHNAPPRGGIKNLTEKGEPIYGQKDEVDLNKIKNLGLPFWLAGSYAEPEKLLEAKSLGATGVQVGTAFAYCEESGMSPDLKQKVIEQSSKGSVSIFTDPCASPTGFPIKVVDVEGTVSKKEEYLNRERVCDLSFLRQAYCKENGKLGYRCPSEPLDKYLKKDGVESDTEGRKCLCNGLMAVIGLGQLQSNGKEELPILTSGLDVENIARFLKPGADSYTAKDVIDYMVKD